MASPPGSSVARRQVEETIERTLAPVLGTSLARAAVRAQFVRVGIDGDALIAAQVDALLVSLEKALRVFVGTPKAAALVLDVRTALPEATDA